MTVASPMARVREVDGAVYIGSERVTMRECRDAMSKLMAMAGRRKPDHRHIILIRTTVLGTSWWWSGHGETHHRRHAKVYQSADGARTAIGLLRRSRRAGWRYARAVPFRTSMPRPADIDIDINSYREVR